VRFGAKEKEHDANLYADPGVRRVSVRDRILYLRFPAPCVPARNHRCRYRCGSRIGCHHRLATVRSRAVTPPTTIAATTRFGAEKRKKTMLSDSKRMFWLVIVLVLAITAFLVFPQVMTLNGLAPAQTSAADSVLAAYTATQIADMRGNATVEQMPGQWIIMSDVTIPIVGGMEWVFVARKGNESNLVRACLNRSSWSTQHMSLLPIRGTEVQVTLVIASPKYCGIPDRTYFAY